MAAGLSLLLCLAAGGGGGGGGANDFGGAGGAPGAGDFLAGFPRELRMSASHRLTPLDHYSDFDLGWTCRTYPPRGNFLADGSKYFPSAGPPVAGFFVGHLEALNLDFTLILLPMWFVVSLFAILPL